MSDAADPETPIVTLRASNVRRVFALGILLLLAFLLLWIAAVHPPQVLNWRLFLFVAGLGVIWLAEQMRHATRLTLVLTAEDLSDSRGNLRVPVDLIASVERGLFAFKPSNGFVLRLNAPVRRRWAPGIYWAVGRRVGVGGVTSASDAKAMAEVISALLAARQTKA